MDIQGLVNHTPVWDQGRRSSLTPPENTVSNSIRSQALGQPARAYQLFNHLSTRDREDIYPSNYVVHRPNERDSSTSPPKREAEIQSPQFPVLPAKRRFGQGGDSTGKATPPRRRALQACEACRAKKSKCDNDRPSCGSCLQHGMECVYKGTPFIPVLDPASTLLMEKLNKMEATMTEQSTMIRKIHQAASRIEPVLRDQPSFLDRIRTGQNQPNSKNPGSEELRGSYASLDYFMSLPYIQNLFLHTELPATFVCHTVFTPLGDTRLPNLQRFHVQRLVDRYLTDIHLLHPIIEAETVERLAKEIDEAGVSWSGETAIILIILAIGALLEDGGYLEYILAAKKRWGFAVENVDIISIQVHYLNGLFHHLSCQPMRAARSFHQASTTAYLYSIQSSDREYTDMERRIFWECLKMETRYRVEISLPDTGLAGLNLLAESEPWENSVDSESIGQRAYRLDLYHWKSDVHTLTTFYSRRYPDLEKVNEDEELKQCSLGLKDSLISKEGQHQAGYISKRLEMERDASALLFHRLFLQHLLNEQRGADNFDIKTISPNILTGAQKAIDLSVKVISGCANLAILDWLNLSRVVIASFLTIAVFKSSLKEFVSSANVVETLNSVRETLSKAAKMSESAAKALKLLCEIQKEFEVDL